MGRGMAAAAFCNASKSVSCSPRGMQGGYRRCRFGVDGSVFTVSPFSCPTSSPSMLCRQRFLEASLLVAGLATSAVLGGARVLFLECMLLLNWNGPANRGCLWDDWYWNGLVSGGCESLSDEFAKDGFLNRRKWYGQQLLFNRGEILAESEEAKDAGGDTICPEGVNETRGPCMRGAQSSDNGKSIL